MNKKLNITGEEYKHRIRQQSKARTMQFRAEQEKRGYKNLTVFLSEPFRAELDRLLDEKGLNRQGSMDYIFEVYQQVVNGSVTSNVILDSDKTVKNPVNIEPDEKPVVKKPKKPTEKQTGTPGPEPDKSRTIELIAGCRIAGDSWQAIADKLNAQGILTPRGEAWTKANAQVFFNRNKEAK